jgi:hypothetical protein
MGLLDFLSAMEQLKRLGLDHKKQMDTDLAHLKLMGVDVIRLHVLDIEISDKKGNLVDNVHLDLLDYLVHKGAQVGMSFYLCPIARWGSPSDVWGGGFAADYQDEKGRLAMTNNPKSWPAQKNYVSQFLGHVNSYSKTAYKDDPHIIGWETMNENSEQTNKEWIDFTVKAFKEAGARAPVFTCCFAGWEKVDESLADGSSVNGYHWDWKGKWEFDDGPRPNLLPDYTKGGRRGLHGYRYYYSAKKPNYIYEWDAFTWRSSYDIFPAAARLFRSDNVQVASYFQYDPLATASHNADWSVHFLNLCYTPRKAVSFMIGGEVFHRWPGGNANRGTYPQNNEFEAGGARFVISYEKNQSLMLSEKYIYSGDTDRAPPGGIRVKQIVGCGSSPYVKYSGYGAYFVDLAPDQIEIRVLPDLYPLCSPYSHRTSHVYGDITKVRQLGVLVSQERRMELCLPDQDIGTWSLYRVANGKPVKEENCKTGSVLYVKPGHYALCKGTPAAGNAANGDACLTPEVPKLAEDKKALITRPFMEWEKEPIPVAGPDGKKCMVREVLSAGKDLTLFAEPVNLKDKTVKLHYRVGSAGQMGEGFKSLEMKRAPERGSCHLTASIRAEELAKGKFLECYFEVVGAGPEVAYPEGGDKANPVTYSVGSETR